MIITTQITEDYYNKCGDFFDSLICNYDKSKVKIGCVDFIPKDCPFETYFIPSEKTLYHNYKCSSRKKYISLQHGEFMDYIGDVSEPILNIDADVILQDKIGELNPKENELLVTDCAFPSFKLIDVAKRPQLKCKDIPKLSFIYDLERLEFSAAFICATPSTWKYMNLMFKGNFENVKLIDHHAGGMFLINCIANKFFDVTRLPSYYHNADWFFGNNCKLVDGWLMDGENKVKVIHTKFNGNWKWKTTTKN